MQNSPDRFGPSRASTFPPGIIAEGCIEDLEPAGDYRIVVALERGLSMRSTADQSNRAPILTMACHCRGCQRMSASAFSLTAMFPNSDFAPGLGGISVPVRGIHQRYDFGD